LAESRDGGSMELTEKCKERGLLYIPRKGDGESRIIIDFPYRKV
jgi:hypothetical protein